MITCSGRCWQKEMETIMEQIYRWMSSLPSAIVARTKGFGYAQALPGENRILRAAALSHPGLEKAVANPVSLHQDSNMLFPDGRPIWPVRALS